MSSKLEMIDEKLRSLRVTSEERGRAAQRCKENRENDPFQMDRQRHQHLATKVLVDREIADLEHARRCELPVGGSVGDGGWRPATPGFVGSDH
jgi:hypothetical protein